MKERDSLPVYRSIAAKLQTVLQRNEMQFGFQLLLINPHYVEISSSNGAGKYINIL